MAVLEESQGKRTEIEKEVQGIIAELNVALSFVREADETPDQERQRQLLHYAQIAHHAVVRLLPNLALSGLNETRVNIRLLQIQAGLKNHGVSVGCVLQRPNMVITRKKAPKTDPYIN